MMNYQVGDVVQMKKPHPCGTNEWEVLRVGADFKLRIISGTQLSTPFLKKFEKSVKKVIRKIES